jgi:hypothetical protein
MFPCSPRWAVGEFRRAVSQQGTAVPCPYMRIGRRANLYLFL